MSNAMGEFMTFQATMAADPTLNAKLVLVNGAQSGKDVDNWAELSNPVWSTVDSDLAAAGVTPAQVQVVWSKQAEQFPYKDGAFPSHAQELQSDLEAIARNSLTKYPNTKIEYLSTRTHPYPTDLTFPNPEPYAYETGFAVKWTIQDQINGVGNLNYNPANGPVVAPLLLWGPYIWATSTPRSDGFAWLPSDVSPTDHTHPTPSGRQKVADQLQAYFKTDPSATPWFLAPTPSGQGPQVTITASTTSGRPGLSVNFTGSATDSGGIPTQYAWTYDDGDFSLSQNPTKIFDVPGTYVVHLTVSDNRGYTGMQSITITISSSHSSTPLILAGSTVNAADSRAVTPLAPSAPLTASDSRVLDQLFQNPSLFGTGEQEQIIRGRPDLVQQHHSAKANSLESYLRALEEWTARA
jgi:PKD repeat protein